VDWLDLDTLTDWGAILAAIVAIGTPIGAMLAWSKSLLRWFGSLFNLQKQLEPEFSTIDNVLNQHLDLQSPNGREIALIIQSLYESCPE